MSTISLEDAQSRLADLVASLAPGQEVVITQDDRPVARLIGDKVPRLPRQPGNCQGLLTMVSVDDEHLRDFSEYME